MDARHYSVSEVESPASPDSDHPEQPRRGFLLDPSKPPSDLVALVEEAASSHQAMEATVSLYLWGQKAFEREANSGESWRERLAAAQQTTQDGKPGSRVSAAWEGAPTWVAAVCARDHWPEMDPLEQRWCVNQMISAVSRDADSLDPVGMGTLDAPGPAALALGAVCSYDIAEPMRVEVQHALALALTHSAERVVAHAAEGISAYIGPKNPAFVITSARRLNSSTK